MSFFSMKKGEGLIKKWLSILVAILVISTGCQQTTLIKKLKGNRQLKLNFISIEKINNYKTNRDMAISKQDKTEDQIKEFIKQYLELAYLDLDIFDKKEEFLDLFGKSIMSKADSQFDEITIGKAAERIDSIKNASVTINQLSIVWDENNKPVLELVDYEVNDLIYISGSANITGQVKGSLVMTKGPEQYKIIDYTVKKKLQILKEKKN